MVGIPTPRPSSSWDLLLHPLYVFRDVNSPVTDLHHLRANSEKCAPEAERVALTTPCWFIWLESKCCRGRSCGHWVGVDALTFLMLSVSRLCRCTFPSVESPYLMLSSLLPRGKNTKEAGWVRGPCWPCSSSLCSQPLWVTPSFKSSRWPPYSPGTILVGTISQCQGQRPLYTICKLEIKVNAISLLLLLLENRAGFF